MLNKSIVCGTPPSWLWGQNGFVIFGWMYVWFNILIFLQLQALTNAYNFFFHFVIKENNTSMLETWHIMKIRFFVLFKCYNQASTYELRKCKKEKLSIFFLASFVKKWAAQISLPLWLRKCLENHISEVQTDLKCMIDFTVIDIIIKTKQMFLVEYLRYEL